MVRYINHYTKQTPIRVMNIKSIGMNTFSAAIGPVANNLRKLGDASTF